MKQPHLVPPATAVAAPCQFVSVLLEEPIPRPTGHMGQASSETSQFKVGTTNLDVDRIELDPATCLLWIVKGERSVCVPLSRVKRLCPPPLKT